MANDFQREYLLRLPLPLAQLYGRAHNAKDARARHDNTFYLFEALIKLAAAPAIAAYLAEAAHGGQRSAPLDKLLTTLALPSLGQWLNMLRELARHFGTRVDAATHPLGHLWQQLNTAHRDLPAALALYQQIKNGPDGEPAGAQSVSLLQLLDALVLYRNTVFGHGGPRLAEFYERQMGPLLFPAANEVLADGVCHWLGVPGTRLIYLTELRATAADQFELGLRELLGTSSERASPLVLTAAQSQGLVPNRVAILWPGRKTPLPLDPLLAFRESELAEELLFLNRDRNSRQVEYLSYTTGRTERDREMLPAMARLLSQVTARSVTADDLKRFQSQSLAETPSFEALAPSETPTKPIQGDYEILAEIGRGGMGVVYLARQLSLGRLVALKMLPADLAADEVALARFRREMRSLARCDHPNIVKVLASGTLPDGQLYYAMEYVPGADLEQVWREVSGTHRQGDASSLGTSTWAQAVLSAAKKQRDSTFRKNASNGTAASLSPLPLGEGRADGKPAENENTVSANAFPLPPLPELPNIAGDPGDYARRVAILIRDAALALQTVHDQGIIHRDVKPANLMLTPDGSRVVLMDFGLAKGQSLALTRTAAGGFLGTLRYAAPEQLAAATLAIGPAADVRGLGVVLWELLTRRQIFAEADDERQLAQCVHEQDVPLLRSVDPTLSEDLEAIVARATERRAADRIALAGDLARYLQLFLDGEPLPIRPPNLVELTHRWVQEHRTLVAISMIAMLLVIATVASAFALVTKSRNDAVAQERLAQAAAKAERVAKEAEQLLRKKAETAAIAERRAKEAERGAKEAAVAAQLRAEAVKEQLVTLFLSPDPRYDGATRTVLQLLDRSAEEIQRGSIADPQTRASLLAAISESYFGLGLYGRAIPLCEQVRELRTKVLGPDHPETLTSINNLATAYSCDGRFDDAIPLLEELVKLNKAKRGLEHPDTLASMSNLAGAYYQARKFQEAILLYEETVERRKQVLGPDHPQTLTSMSGLSTAYGGIGQLDKLFKLSRETLELRKAKLGPQHPDTLRSMNYLADAYAFANCLEEAFPLYELSLTVRNEKLGSEHPDSVGSMFSLAMAYSRAGRLVMALPLYEELLVKYQRSNPGSRTTLMLTKMLQMIQRLVSQSATQNAALASCRVWRYPADANSEPGEYRQQADEWVESKSGKELARYHEKHRAVTHIDLFDEKRTLWVRLAADHSYSSYDGVFWAPLYQGAPVDSMQ